VTENATITCIQPGSRPVLDTTDPGLVDSLYWFKYLANIAYCLDNDAQGQNETVCAQAEGGGITLTSFTPLYPGRLEGKLAGYLGYMSNSSNGTPLDTPIIVVGFRGTSNAQEAAADAQARQIPCSTVGITETVCGVHEGFSNTYNALRDELRVDLNRYLDRYPGAMVRVVGHSLGGALSAIAAQEIARNYTKGLNPKIKDLAVYTYGEPRVFSPPFAPIYRSQLVTTHYRVVNHHDPVPQVPPNTTVQLGNYTHIGTPYFIFDVATTNCTLDYLATGTCELLNGTGEDTDCQNTLWNWKAGFEGPNFAATTSAASKSAEWLDDHFWAFGDHLLTSFPTRSVRARSVRTLILGSRHYLDNYFLGYVPKSAFPGQDTGSVVVPSPTATVGPLTTSRPASAEMNRVSIVLFSVIAAVMFYLL
jgi:pimeloyl-ACP methyl ester carboxylesterase